MGALSGGTYTPTTTTGKMGTLAVGTSTPSTTFRIGTLAKRTSTPTITTQIVDEGNHLLIGI